MEEPFVVLDVNVLIPLLLPASKSTRPLKRLHAQRFRVATTPAPLADVEGKLRTKQSLRKWLGVDDQRVTRFLADLRHVCAIVSGTVETPGAVAADPDDDRVLAAAVEWGAQFLVTEDRHLLDLNPWCNINIVTRDEILDHLDTLS